MSKKLIESVKISVPVLSLSKESAIKNTKTLILSQKPRFDQKLRGETGDFRGKTGENRGIFGGNQRKIGGFSGEIGGNRGVFGGNRGGKKGKNRSAAKTKSVSKNIRYFLASLKRRPFYYGLVDEGKDL